MGQSCGCVALFPVESCLLHFRTQTIICPKIYCQIALKKFGFPAIIVVNKGVVGTYVRQYQHTGLIPGIA